MADLPQKKFSELDPMSTMNDADFAAVYQGGEVKAGSVSLIKDTVLSSIDDLTSQTEAEPANLAVIRDGTDSKKITLLDLKRYFDGNIGDIKYHDTDDPDAEELGDWWQPMSGQVISNPLSPYNGKRLRNINGANVVLTGVTWVSGVATIPATDVTALSVGDDVTGAGIAENTYIDTIVGTTVTLTDTAISATIDTTFTNNGIFVRGGVLSGVGKKDEMQLTEGSFEIRDGQYTIGDRVPLTSNYAGMVTDGGDGYAGTNRVQISGNLGTKYIVNISNANSPNARTSSTTAGESHPHYVAMVVYKKIY